MAILIKRKKVDRKSREGKGGRSVILFLMLIQLPLTIGVIVFAYALLTSFKYQGIPLEKIGPYTAITDTMQSFRAYRFPVSHWLGLAEEMPIINLDINQENYRILEYTAQHDAAALAGLIDDENIRREIFVKADIRIDDDSVPVKVRLKGDRRVHWRDPDKWSFRVEVRGDRSLFGMRRFSLQKPVTRNYIYEWFFHKVLKREGIIGLRYNFVKLNVNGKALGVYAVEEHFDKILLESNNRREAPILRFSEAAVTIDKDWFQMTVTPYGRKRWMERNPEMLRQATNLLEDFQYGRKTVGEVFDVQLLARYYAIVDLMDSFHGALAKSIKFYYNPINKKLEPIGFDAQFNDRKFPVLVAELSDFRSEKGYSNSAYFETVFGPDIYNKVEFWESYVRELERLSDPEYLDDLFADIDEELEENLDRIYAEPPWHAVMSGHQLTTGARPLFYFGKDKFYERQHFIRMHLRPKAAVAAYLIDVNDQRAVLQIANTQKLPLEVIDIVHNGIVYKPVLQRLLLNEKPRYQPLDYAEYEFVAAKLQPPAEKLKKSQRKVTPKRRDSAIRYRVPGSSHSSEFNLFDWQPAVVQKSNEVPYNRYMELEARRFLLIDEASKIVKFRAGSWEITKDVVIPEGYTLMAGPGVTIDLLQGSRLVSFSPVKFIANEISPVLITSSDRSGKGIVVLEADQRSQLDFVRFSNLALADGEPWTLTSVVTFHRSDIDISNSFFGDNQSEDALNIIRSNFSIVDSSFANTFGDAFDSDFSDGVVANTAYKNIGNDAIDVSGTSIVVRNVSVEDAGDKGLSVGEASRMEGEFVTIKGANIGIAVKDKSHFEGMTVTIQDVNVAFTLFQKKPEYGPASAAIWRTSFSDVRDTHWLEEGSSLSWDGVPVKPNKVDLKKVLYAEEYQPKEAQPAESAAE